MANPISIARVDDVESLRKATEVAVNRHITQVNKTDHSLQQHFNANGFKVQNLGNPAGQKDAVPLDYLERALKKLKAASSPQRRVSGGEHCLAHYGIGIGFPVAVGTDVTAHHIVALTGTFESAYINSKLGPTGADLIIDIQRWNGSSWASIFGGTKLVLPDGALATDVATQTTFAIAGPIVGQLLRADITQIGSTYPGSEISVMLRWVVT